MVRDDNMHVHLTGTQFFEALDDPRIEETRDVWSQELISEDSAVYRSEYLAHLMLPELLALPDSDRDDLLGHILADLIWTTHFDLLFLHVCGSWTAPMAGVRLRA